MKKKKLLPIGTTVYLLIESFTDHSFSDQPFHYEIVTGEVKGYICGGFTQYRVPTKNRLGRTSNLKFPRTTDLGKSMFLAMGEAVAFAERQTDEHESKCSRFVKEPLLRPWRENNDRRREEATESQAAPVQEADCQLYELSVPDQ